MIPPHKELWDNLNNDSRYYIVTGGRGSGKSFEVGRFACILSFMGEQKILFTRQTMTSAHLSIIPEFQEKIDLLEISDLFDVTRSEIINRQSGSQIIFKGLKTSSGDQTANLKSLQGVSTWILDEAEELTSEETFDKINLSLRQKGVHNRIILILNPSTKEHWIYKRFFESKGVEAGFVGQKGDTTYIHSTYSDNLENLDISFLNEVERIKTTNPRKYEHIVLGGWIDRAEGVVFDNWSFGKFNPDGLQTSCGMDFGFSIDPDTLTEVAIDKAKMKLYAKQHIYQKGLKSQDLATLVKAKVGNSLIIADSSEPRLIADLSYLGVNVKAVKKGTIESGITRMQDFEIIVDPDSQEIAKELNNYVYADKTSKLYVDSYNHAIDGIRYNVIFHLDNPNKGTYHIY